MSDELVTTLVQLVAAPDRVDLRRRAAELLDQHGHGNEARAIARPLVNFTGHDDSGILPCLCKTCSDAAGDTAEARGMTFHRAFAISGERVLHYWLVDELAADRAAVRRSVGEALRTKLQRRAR
jgi:glycine cleavage system regulatory protein